MAVLGLFCSTKQASAGVLIRNNSAVDHAMALLPAFLSKPRAVSSVNDLEYSLGRGFVDADHQFTVSVFRKGIIATAATGDDFGEKESDLAMHAVCAMLNFYHGSRDSAVIDIATPGSAPVQRQRAGRQALEFAFQGFFDGTGPARQRGRKLQHQTVSGWRPALRRRLLMARSTGGRVTAQRSSRYLPGKLINMMPIRMVKMP